MKPVRPGQICLLLLALLATGCGTTKSRTATQQLLLSDAIDQAVASIDFRPLSGQKVYFDTSYIAEVKNFGFVNSEYIISSLRQQMVAANCLLQEKKEDADFIVEGRVGTVGTDANEMVYGMPASNGLSTAASLMPNAPPIPTIPEISIARRNAELGAAKIAVFAYHRETKEPVWQSGIARAKSTAQDMWVFGAGPFQKGTIYDGIRFAGSRIRIPALGEDGENDRPLVSYDEAHLFDPRYEQERLAQHEKVDEILENLPDASPQDWLTPLEPSYSTPLEDNSLWR